MGITPTAARGLVSWGCTGATWGWEQGFISRGCCGSGGESGSPAQSQHRNKPYCPDLEARDPTGSRQNRLGGMGLPHTLHLLAGPAALLPQAPGPPRWVHLLAFHRPPPQGVQPCPGSAWPHGTMARQPACHMAPVCHVIVPWFSSNCTGHSSAASAAPLLDCLPGSAWPCPCPCHDLLLPRGFQVPALMNAPPMNAMFLCSRLLPSGQCTRTTSPQQPTSALALREGGQSWICSNPKPLPASQALLGPVEDTHGSARHHEGTLNSPLCPTRNPLVTHVSLPPPTLPPGCLGPPS